MLLTESTLHDKDQGVPEYTTFIDASKAFDIVDHDSALNHLYKQGVHGKLWCCFISLYTDITSIIRWKGELSSPITEGQGIRQGDNSSTDIFKSRSTPTLYRLGDHPDSLKIGHIKPGALQVADDLVLSSSTSDGAHALVTEAQVDASRERF